MAASLRLVCATGTGRRAQAIEWIGTEQTPPPSITTTSRHINDGATKGRRRRHYRPAMRGGLKTRHEPDFHPRPGPSNHEGFPRRPDLPVLQVV